MSVASRQFLEMVREAYSQLQHRRICQCVYTPVAAKLCNYHCPACGGELVEKSVAEVVYFVHKENGG